MADVIESAVTSYALMSMFFLGGVCGIFAEKGRDAPWRWRLYAIFGWPVMLFHALIASRKNGK